MESKKNQSTLQKCAEDIQKIKQHLDGKAYQDPVRKQLLDQYEFMKQLRQNFYKELLEFDSDGIKNLNNVVDSSVLEEKDEQIERLKYRILHLTRSLQSSEKQSNDKIEKLEEQNSRLKYRISHLVRNLQD